MKGDEIVRKVYDEFFRIQQHEKIGEKVIVVRMILTVISIVTCLIMMSLTAFAYFSCNVTSDSNRINTANFETKVSINVTSSNGESVTVNLTGQNLRLIRSILLHYNTQKKALQRQVL